MKTVSAFLEKLQMPQDCIDALCACERRIADKPEFAAALSCFMSGEADRARAKTLLSALSEAAAEQPYESDAAVVLRAFLLLEQKYEALGLAHALYENACRDVRCKLWECRRVYGVWGTFVAPWFLRWLVPSRFAFGRLQFETAELSLPDGVAAAFTLPDGKRRTVQNGSAIIRVHIPSTGEPLTQASCMDAYRQAWTFYKDNFKDGWVLFSCKSWLLYEKNPQILPETSNILRFMRDFYVFPDQNDKPFADLWRIFGAPNDTPFAQLPEDTSLQRAYKAHLLEGGCPGEGTGVFWFDGKTICNKPLKL